MKKRKQISSDEAKRIGDSLYVDWDQVDLEQFRQGLMGNQRPAALDPEAGPIYDGVLLAGKSVLAHIQEIPDYFTRLARLKAELLLMRRKSGEADETGTRAHAEVFSNNRKEVL